MKRKSIKKTIIAASLSLIIAAAAGSYNTAYAVSDPQSIGAIERSGDNNDTNIVVTEYSDLWTGTVAFKVGEPVSWYVHVPDDVTPKGCGATVKIPGLGWGTEANSKDEGHLTLTQGDNLVYEFTPDKTGDFIFTCLMGSGCHSNYIHVTEDGTYTAEKPDDPSNIRAERNGSEINVSFDAPTVSSGVTITGYKIIAADQDGKRKKIKTEQTSAVLEDLNEGSEYTITVYTLSTAGSSAGENTVTVDANTKTPETIASDNDAKNTSGKIITTGTANSSATAKTSSKVSDTSSSASSKQSASSTASTTAAAAASTQKTTAASTSNAASSSSSADSAAPKTGSTRNESALAVLTASFSAILLLRKRRNADEQ